MSAVNIHSMNGKVSKKGQASMLNLRVDFTPMVDMNMLLITFFMFCTTLATPQVMDIVMPTRDKIQSGMQSPSSKTTTLLLGENHKIYYYLGIPQYDDPSTLKVTDLSPNGLRNLLLDKNADMFQQMQSLKEKRRRNEISEVQFNNKMLTLKKSKEGQTIIIKPTNESSYCDLINTLDEMQICGVARYAIVEMDDADKYLLGERATN